MWFSSVGQAKCEVIFLMLKLISKSREKLARRRAKKNFKRAQRNEIKAQRRMKLWAIPVSVGLFAIFDKRKK